MQTLTEIWGRLDWANFFLSLVGAVVAGLLYTKVINPLWVKSRSASKLILNKQKKWQILRDWKKVVQFRAEKSALIAFGFNKLASICFECMMVILLFQVAIAVGADEKAKLEVIRIFRSETGFSIFFGAAAGILIAAMFMQMSELTRLNRYFADFPEFEKQASAILTIEEMGTAVLEKRPVNS